jgi:hypothetical protein
MAIKFMDKIINYEEQIKAQLLLGQVNLRKKLFLSSLEILSLL